MIKLELANMANEHSKQVQEYRQREIRAKEYSETVRKARKQEKILFLNFMNNATVIFATLLLIISLIVSG